MTRSERAKQFMPFAALKGYEDALRMKEKIVAEKIELSDELKEELDYKLRMIKKNDIVTLIYFGDDEYLEITGMVSRIDVTSSIIKIVNTKIDFKDIYKIEIKDIYS